MTLDLDRAPSRLGVIVGGSLSKGLEARLDADVPIEDQAVGRYVVVHGQQRDFFGMITDVRLSAANPELALNPPDLTDPLVAEVVSGTSTFGTIEIATMLTIDRNDRGSAFEGPRPVKTVPSHFAPVADATDADVQLVFGAEDENHFHVGQPLDMDTKVCLDLKRFVERSSGVFGKTGTGKTFLTRLLLAGIVQKHAAVNLVFDMHSEYGWRGTGERGFVKGLKQLFNDRVSVFTLDPEFARQAGAKVDHVVEIPFEQIEPKDFELLKDALGMTEAQCESIYRLAHRFGPQWLVRFADTEAADREGIAVEFGLNPGTLNVLHRKIERLARLPFLKRDAVDDSVKRMLESFARGRHVVLEFGRHRSIDAYILVANVLTRRIYERYQEQVNQAGDDMARTPPHLVITIEEAHKFLNEKVADLTTFGMIARELRKYRVTLLVVDQRPSSIADEVMSQIGTRVTCLLDDEKDINAVLGGVPGASTLRSVLARLDTKQQAILLGHAVPMPVVIRTREYGERFYADLARAKVGANGREKSVDEIFGR